MMRAAIPFVVNVMCDTLMSDGSIATSDCKAAEKILDDTELQKSPTQMLITSLESIQVGVDCSFIHPTLRVQDVRRVRTGFVLELIEGTTA